MSNFKLPRRGTSSEAVLRHLAKHRKSTIDGIMDALPSINRYTIHSALSTFGVTHVEGVYHCPFRIAQHFGCADAEFVQAPVRTFLTKPLSGYDAMMRRGRELRDVSFMSASGAPSHIW
jgi:hypothetical protein